MKAHSAALHSRRERGIRRYFSRIISSDPGAVLTYRAVFQLFDAQYWVAHTRDVQAALSSISTVSSRAGGRRVEYVHTGDESRLVGYQAAERG